jgi:hypothetical protein
MNLFARYFRICILLGFGTILSSTSAIAQKIIDPETYIQKVGAQSTKIGEDGKTRFFRYTELASEERIATLSRAIAELPKAKEVLQVCDQVRGSVSAKLSKEKGRPIVVTITSYGYSGSIIACEFKYRDEDKTGIQLMFVKQATDGVYTLFITN